MPFYENVKKKKIKIISNSGVLTRGNEVEKLERTVANITGKKHAIAVSSCSQGIFLSCRILKEKGIKKMIIPSFTWPTSWWAAEFNGMEIIPADINRNTFNMLYEDEFDDKTGMMPVHVFGNTFNQQINAPSVVDAAWSMGARGAADIGQYTVFSFAPTKPITSCEGGIIVTDENDERLRELVCKFSRMSEIHACVANHCLEHIDEILQEKAKIAKYYHKHIHAKFQEIEYSTNYGAIALLFDNQNERDGFFDGVQNQIECRKYYIPMSPTPNAVDVFNRICCIPSWIGVDYKEVTEICNVHIGLSR